jgi:dipeptidyl aminopeptidase/acylaminoacyl peptidase
MNMETVCARGPIGSCRIDVERKTLFHAALLFLLSCVFMAGDCFAKDALTLEKLMQIDRVSSVALSPDGESVAYVLEKTSAADHGKKYDVFVSTSGELGSRRRILVDGEGVGQPQWAADGQSIYYLSSQTGTAQLWNVPTSHGEPRQVTDLALGIMAFRLADNDHRLVVAHNVFPDCATLVCTQRKIEVQRQRKDTGVIYRDGAAPRFMGTYEDGRFVNIFDVALPTAGSATRSTPLTPGYRYDILESAFGLQQDFALGPSGDVVYFAARPSGSNQGDELPKAIYRTDTSGTGRLSIVAQRAGSSLSSPRVSPDGRRLAYLQADGSVYTAPRMTVWVQDLETGRKMRVGGDLDSVLSATFMNDLQWSPDGRTLYAVGQDRMLTRLFSMPSDGTPTFDRIPTEGSVGGYALGGGSIAYIHSRLTQSPEVSVVRSAKPGIVVSTSTLRTSGSDRFALATVDPFTFRGWNGDVVDGLLMKPAGYVPGRTYPVILQMHGGPNNAFSDGWDASPISAQLFAARGYAVVMINPHGSSGYGTPFGRAVLGHWSDRPLIDLKLGWAHVLRGNRFIDERRACAMGASYGGYLALLIAGQWQEPWKCLFAGSPVFDIRSFYYSNDITAYDKLSFAPKPWLERAYAKHNPATYVSRWRTPLFIVGGTADFRVPHDQNIAAYMAARTTRVPSQILVFDGESHGVRMPHNMLRLFSETIDWFDRWTKPFPGDDRQESAHSR